MLSTSLWLGVLTSLQISLSNARSIGQTCTDIGAQLSDGGDVLTFGLEYLEAINHWLKSSEQLPTCVIQPATVQDLSVALRLVGQRRVPFAVQSGGHTSNPGFSSTTGVHISLSKLNQVTLSPDGSSVRVGFGNRWLDVYEQLEGSGRNVVGGRVPGPGLGGFTLGGGYSWKTNTYGLTIDTVKSFTLVLPNGTIAIVDNSRPDLFFALRGGLNRFGVVADAELYTHPQVPLIYGGTRLYGPDQLDKVVNATYVFEQTNTDPKANVIASFLGSALGATVQFFYDGPSKPSSFAAFDGINVLLLDTVKTQSFSSFVGSIPSNIREPLNFRGTWDTFSTTRTTPRFVQALRTEADRLSKLPRAPTGINLAVDAYIPGMYGQHAVGNTAFPHSDSQFPVLLDVAWLSILDDSYWRDQVRQSRNLLRDVAQAEGILHPISYSNYARGDTSAQELWSAENAARLKSIKDAVDPTGVMKLAGGYQI